VVPRELERVQAVIEDMMELARPATIHREPVNLNELVTQVLNYTKVRRAGRASRSSASTIRNSPSVWPTENVSIGVSAISHPMPSRRCRPAGT